MVLPSWTLFLGTWTSQRHNSESQKWNILALVFAVTLRGRFVGKIREYRIEMLHVVRNLTGAYDNFDSASLKPQALLH